MLVIIFQLWQKYIKSIVLHVSCITYGKSHLRFDLNVFFKLEYVIYEKSFGNLWSRSYEVKKFQPFSKF